MRHGGQSLFLLGVGLLIAASLPFLIGGRERKGPTPDVSLQPDAAHIGFAR